MTIIPVHLLTGFLGSGKTTLLNGLLREPALADTAVLINEFGEVAIDHDLVGTVDGEMIVTTTGCLCCTASSDVLGAIDELEARRRSAALRPFRRVIVETTGLADPAPVVNSLTAGLNSPPGGAAARDYRLASVLTLYDAVNGEATLDMHFEALKQVALADAIILTKTDLASDPASSRDIAASRERIAHINPAAEILDRQHDWPKIVDRFKASGTYDLSDKSGDALAWLKAEAVLGHQHARGGHDINRHGDRIEATVITHDEPLDPRGFYFFLEMLRLSAGPKILRLKGLVALADDPDRPIVVHGVQHVIHPVEKLDRWPSDDRRTRMVLIGHELKPESIRRMLAGLKPASAAADNVASSIVRWGKYTKAERRESPSPDRNSHKRPA